MRRPSTTTTTALAFLAALALLAGCGSGGGSTGSGADVLKQKALENDLSSRLAQAAGGGASPTVTCPGDLPVKAGLTMRCRAEVAGTEYGVTVTVKGEQGGSAQYDVQVDQNPT